MRKAAVVIASGPSLTIEDVQAVKDSGLFTIVVNNTWEKAPWADILYAGDNCWWKHNYQDVEKANLKCKFYSCSKPAEKLYGATYRERRVKPGYNSGANACELAAHLGYNLIIMLGFDCSVKYGIHHHGPHKKTGNPNPVRCEQWKKQFASLNKLYPKVKFLNCSGYTELTFTQANLEKTLQKYS